MAQYTKDPMIIQLDNGDLISVSNSNPRYISLVESGEEILPYIPPIITPHMLPYVDVSFATSKSCNGKYSLSNMARSNIHAIYSGIKSGDGLPGGGETFFYPDVNDVMKEFTPDVWVAFSLAIRDFVYALDQGQNPVQPVSINA